MLHRANPLWVFRYAVSRLVPVCVVVVFTVSVCLHPERSFLSGIRNVLIPCAGIVIGALIGSFFAPFDPRGVINITETAVQGPPSQIKFHPPREILLIHVDIAKCQPIGLIQSGRIIATTGETIVISPIFFSPEQAKKIFAEIQTRMEGRVTV